MTLTRWWTLVAVLAVAVGAPLAPAVGKKKTEPAQKTAAPLTQKNYPVGDLVGEGREDAEMLVKFVKHAVRPASWSGRGGTATISYSPAGKCLVVDQTTAAHTQIDCLLKALVKLQSDAERRHERGPLPAGLLGAAAGALIGQGVVPAGYCPTPPAPTSAPKTAKQYGHFVLDNVRVNAMGVTATVKKIKFMYKGDGIDGDVAKCYMTGGQSERKADAEKVLEEVGRLLDEKKEKKPEEPKACPAPCVCPAPCACPCPAPVCVPVSPVFNPVSVPKCATEVQKAAEPEDYPCDD